jgi:hypothetical protein
MSALAQSISLSFADNEPESLSDADCRQLALEMIRASHARGETLSGEAVAEPFRKTDRWGRRQLQEFRKGLGIPQHEQLSDDMPSDRNAPTATGTTPAAHSDITMKARQNGKHDGNGTVGRATVRPVRLSLARPDNDSSGRNAPGEPHPSQLDDTTDPQQRITTIAVIVVAAVAAAASYDHQRALADLAGEGWRSWLLPFSVDGLLTAATMLMLTRRRNGQKAGALTWVSLALGVAASVGANVVGADPSLVDPVLVGRLVAAWPRLALFLSLELLMRQLGANRPRLARRGQC